TRSGSGSPSTREAQTTDVPSAITKVACSYSARNDGSRCQRSRWSAFGVISRSRPRRSASRTACSSDSAKVTLWMRTPSTSAVGSGGVARSTAGTGSGGRDRHRPAGHWSAPGARRRGVAPRGGVGYQGRTETPMLTRTAPCLALLCAACRAPARPAVEAHPVNRLANETSPYLLQHRDNPVDWYPWGPEALARARAESRPIFLSIGYAACHWCHVMEHESFEDEGTAALMNELFVNVKVDREERPDLDEIYMAATIGFAGHGGWPMSVFLTPDLQPFYAGTYFPPEDRHGLPGFRRVLEHVARLWRERRDEVERAAAGMARSLAQELAPVLPPGEPQWGMVAALVDDSAGRFDAEHGGFGHPPHYAPKFPHAGELAVLLREHARTGDPRARTMAVQTLTAMARGGMFDQLGGGFHRYSTDRRWLVPHFEKMLYDNAQLVRVYLEAAALTGEERFADVARDVLAWMQREMVDPQGGLWSSQDADRKSTR